MVKSILERMSGNEAVAHAIKQVEPDVMPAFPITPSTELPQFVSNFHRQLARLIRNLFR